MEVNWLDLNVVLVWITVLGAPYLTGKLVAYLTENWEKWHTLRKEVKFYVPMAFSLTIAGIAQYLLQGQVELVIAVSPYWTWAVQSILTYLGTQEGYIKARTANYANKARNGN